MSAPVAGEALCRMQPQLLLLAGTHGSSFLPPPASWVPVGTSLSFLCFMLVSISMGHPREVWELGNSCHRLHPVERLSRHDSCAFRLPTPLVLCDVLGLEVLTAPLVVNQGPCLYHHPPHLCFSCFLSLPCFVSFIALTNIYTFMFL